jgi:dienelactone hydrolase
MMMHPEPPPPRATRAVPLPRFASLRRGGCRVARFSYTAQTEDDMDRRSFLLRTGGTGLAMCFSPVVQPAVAQALPETVRFPSLDGTMIVGYLFKPASPRPGASPAVVLLHGRAGPYSSLARGRYDASTLTQRHLLWSRYWNALGAFALLVDSFGPRGFPAGFTAGTHDDRPPQLNEVTVRPLDAYGALKYLAGRKEADAGRIGLQGWSNGGSTVLATMAVATMRATGLPASGGFRAALAFYPGCGLENRFREGYEAYAPVRILIGTADEEVSPERCQTRYRAHGLSKCHARFRRPRPQAPECGSKCGGGDGREGPSQ